jgi:hypothetical protein
MLKLILTLGRLSGLISTPMNDDQCEFLRRVERIADDYPDSPPEIVSRVRKEYLRLLDEGSYDECVAMIGATSNRLAAFMERDTIKSF